MTTTTRGGKSERGREDSLERRRTRRRRGEAVGGGGGCTTKEGEKRSLFYSGGARPAIWSYKINHSSSRAVGAMCQINRRPLLTSLLAIPAPPTSIILDRPRPFSLPPPQYPFKHLALAAASRIHETNPPRVP